MSEAPACPPFLELEELASGGSHAPRASWISEHATSCARCANALSEIRADRDLESRLQRAFDPAAAAAPRALPEIEGYRILGELGRGGMGVVFEAEQLAGRRTVALKVVRGAQYVDETTLRLFQREIRVLARLEHPGIAALYDAGSTAAGEHYFAMELVRGTSLLARARELGRRARIELFRQLCDAIDFAHQRGIVHRDLKPSNVLVTADGRVKVLDFGLAKITDSDVSKSSLVSETGQIRGTLAYMSPEQARGDPGSIDLRSDVYSLGAVLYELLTGKLPTDVFHLHIHEASRRICEDAPVRPSVLDASLRGELETIVLKALEKEPARRYGSAAQLSEDLRRFLGDEVILARPPSASYELRKFVRRHTLPCALAAVVFVLAIGTAAWTSALYRHESELRGEAQLLTQKAQFASNLAEQQAARAREEAARAQREAQTYLRVKDFLVGVFDASSYERRTTKPVTADELLQRGIERIQTELIDDKRLRAALLLSLGDVCVGLHMSARAAPLIEEAVQILRKEAPGSPQLAAALVSLGLLREQTGDPRASIPLHEEAITLFGAGGEAHARNTIAARGTLAQSLRASGELTRAAQLFHDCLEQLRELGEAGSSRYCNLQTSLGVTLYDLGKYDEAQPMLVEAIASLKPAGSSMRLANAINTLGMIFYGRNDYEKADANFQAALQMRLELVEPSNELLASSYNNLAGVRNARDDVQGAIEYLDKAREILVQHHPEGSAPLSMNDHNRARAHLKLGEFERAAQLVDQALAARRASVGNQNVNVAESLVLSAEIHLKRHELDEAEKDLVEALPIYDLRVGRKHINAINARFRLGQVRQEAKDWPAAEQATLEALEDLRGTAGHPSSVQSAIYVQLASIYEGWGKPEEAAKYKSAPSKQP